MVTKRHVAFARAMVALARQHKMDNLCLTFSRGYGGYMDRRDDDEPEGLAQHQQVRMTWRAGRHGAKEQIALHTEETTRVPETDGGPDA